MKYKTVNEFLKEIKKGRSTLYRFYKKNENLYNETKKKRNKRLIPKNHAKYFNSEVLFMENRALSEQNNCMKNLITCLDDDKSLQARLWKLGWTFFVTVAYKDERNEKSCFKKMHTFYNRLIENYGNESGIRMFFTTEPFSNRSGYHNHFLLYIDNPNFNQKVKKEISKFFKNDKVDIKDYDRFKAGLFYLSKGGLLNENWDILGNNLKEEGLKYESKINSKAV